MLDALPPPAFFEEAPDWVQTRSGLIVPKKVDKAVLPGFGGLGLAGGNFGLAQMAPTPQPTASLVAINSAALGTNNPAVSNSAASAAISAYSEILVWAFFRTNIVNDPGTATITITDNQGGTYTRIGTAQRFSYNNGSPHTFVGGLYRRNANAGASGLPATTFTMSSAWTGSNSSGFNSCYVFELKNPLNLPVNIVERLAIPQTLSATFPMTNTGDVFCLDFYAGAAATGAESANSGFTSIAGAATFVSSNLRLQCWASGCQAQNPARTLPANVTYGGVAASFACYFDVVKSARTRTWSVPELVKSSGNYMNTFSTTVNIGSPAPDRQVIIYVGGSADASSAVNFTALTSSGTPVPFQIGNPHSATNCCATIFFSLVPTGTTLDIVSTGTGVPWQFVTVFVLYGCSFIGLNEYGSTQASVGETGAGYNYSAGNTNNAPFQWVSTRYLAKGAVAFGGGGSRGGGCVLVTSNPNSWASAGTGVAQTQPAYRENNSGADELTNSYGISYSGTIASYLAMCAFGP